MRGIDYFPHPDENEWRMIYDRAVARRLVAMAGEGRTMERADFDAVFTHISTVEHDYRNWRRARAIPQPEVEALWTNIPALDVKGLEEKTFGRPALRPFKLTYDTLEEVRMRFNKTVILIKGNPFYVSDQRRYKNEFHLLLEDGRETRYSVPLADVPDFRSPPAGYVQFEGQNGYMTRAPARVNTQGLSQGNVLIQKIGTKGGLSFNNKHLVTAIASRGKLLPWSSEYCKLIDDRIVPEFRLSDTVALYTKKNQQPIFVEYKGRRFGTLEGNTVSASDEDDLIQPWVRRDLEVVNLEVKT